MLEDLNLKFNYNSEDDDLLADFYFPVLAQAKRYDRAVGYFSAKVLEQLAISLVHLVKSKGKMRLIIGEPLSQEEYDAVYSGNFQKVNELSVEFETLVTQSNVTGVQLFGYLISKKYLEVRFALRRRGMFHQKIGIVKDSYGAAVAFNGSANETFNALCDDINSEEITVFPSNHPSFETHGINLVKKFDELWGNEAKNTRVISLDSEIYQRISRTVDRTKLEKLFDVYLEDSMSDQVSEEYSSPYQRLTPEIPTSINGRAFNLYSHQIAAIESWKNNGYRGIFELATGSGKTLTSLCAAINVYQDRINNSKKTVLIIAVPYIELANQWIKELKHFNISPIQCFESKDYWNDECKRKVNLYLSNQLDFMCLLVVNNTLKSEQFQHYVDQIPTTDLIIIGDECHHHGSHNINEALPFCDYRLGLSATPFRSDEDDLDSPFPDEARIRLLRYYSNIVARYTLKDAINDDVLTPYKYYILPVYLTAAEQQQFDELSLSISRLIIMAKKRKLSVENRQRLTLLCGLRSKLLGVAENKLPTLIEHLTGSISNKIHSLFYVGEGKDSSGESNYINLVTKALYQLDWKVARFTSQESGKERKTILTSFKDNTLDALVAMKVLDEGIDIPACDTAYIMASTKNPRQYIQRRGRVLRKSEGKKFATIYDFVVLPAPGVLSQYAELLRSSERERVIDFMNMADNYSDVESYITNIGLL
jgi:superfamily II DNA or RNA helicase